MNHSTPATPPARRFPAKPLASLTSRPYKRPHGNVFATTIQNVSTRSKQAQMGKLSQPTPAGPAIRQQDAAQYEQENVHEVYEQIASHFSSTRYKPWPLVTSFLSTLPPGSVGADLGCGNGKYLHLRSVLCPSLTVGQEAGNLSRSILTLGLDRSSNLIDIAATNLPSPVASTNDDAQQDPGTSSARSRNLRNEVCVGDALQSGYRSQSLDFAMSIATIHHFATQQRRVEAVLELIRIVKPVPPQPGDESDQPATGSGPGRFMIYVWALEQRGESRRDFEGVDAKEGEVQSAGEQDLLVPWVSGGAAPGAGKGASKRSRASKKDDNGAAGEQCRAGQSDAQDSMVQPVARVYQRFYHVFKQGELEALVEEAADVLQQRHDARQAVRIVLQGSGWEKGNWWGVWRVEDLTVSHQRPS